jgi:hypothetical protein
MTAMTPTPADAAPATSRPRRPILRFLRRRYEGWRLRHHLPFNFWIHLIGIPMALTGVVLLFWDWRWGLAAFVLGYLLQWIGHLAEGNDLGEVGRHQAPPRPALRRHLPALEPRRSHPPVGRGATQVPRILHSVRLRPAESLRPLLPEKLL